MDLKTAVFYVLASAIFVIFIIWLYSRCTKRVDMEERLQNTFAFFLYSLLACFAYLFTTRILLLLHTYKGGF